MDEILRQLVPLLIGSVPTMLIFLFLMFAYRVLLHGPLLKVLAKRRQRTEGAVEKANAAIAAADAKAQEYEARLRSARGEIFRVREERVKGWNAERDSALTTARQAARNRIQDAKNALEAQAVTSRQDIERSTEQLAAEILTAILPAGLPPAGVAAAEGSR